MTTSSSHRMHARERGAASLIVVMVLFFLMLLVAAYASRSLIFEQRTSANQYRATQAHEAAQAGVDWALSMLNSNQLVDALCVPDVNAASTFRERYLPADLNAGRPFPAVAVGVRRTMAACMHDGAGGWTCSCPNANDATTTAVADTAVAFIVEMPAVAATATESPLAIDTYGCAGLSAGANCLRTTQTAGVEALALQRMSVSMVHALRYPPAASLTAQGIVSLTTDVRVVNERTNNGIAVETRSAIADWPTIVSTPGTPRSRAVVENNTTLPDSTTPDAFFAAFAGINKTVYQQLPGVKTVLCNGDCSAQLQTDVAQGVQMFWLTGASPMVTGIELGTATRPVMLVSSTDINFQGAVRVNGVVYANALTWNGAGASTAFVKGATVIEGACCAIPAGSTPGFIYDADVLALLRITAGAYARVPGSWIDR
jgi:Tfp pilus assembly protein PilX